MVDGRRTRQDKTTHILIAKRPFNLSTLIISSPADDRVISRRSTCLVHQMLFIHSVRETSERWLGRGRVTAALLKLSHVLGGLRTLPLCHMEECLAQVNRFSGLTLSPF